MGVWSFPENLLDTSTPFLHFYRGIQYNFFSFIHFELHTGKEIGNCWEAIPIWGNLFSSCRGELSDTSLAFFWRSHLSSKDNWLRFPVFFPGKIQSVVLKEHLEVVILTHKLLFGSSVLGTRHFLGYPSLHEGAMNHSEKGLFLIMWKESAILGGAHVFGVLARSVGSFRKDRVTYSGNLYPSQIQVQSPQASHFYLSLLSPVATYTQLPSHSFHHTHSAKLAQGSLALRTSLTLYGSW